VFADGITSTARRRMFPDVGRHYSGYVGWRGTVREDAVTNRTRELLTDALLAPAVAEVVVRTEQPYLQVVADTRIPGSSRWATS
jgi:hypothetical protein